MRYEMTNDLMTGNATIDKEHSELFAAMNAMLDACAKGQGRASIEPTMKFLLNYVNQHFAHEEALHKQSGFENLAAHKQFHASYTQKLQAMAAAIPATGPTLVDLSNLNQHLALLITHIRSTDKKLGAFISGKA